MTWLALVFALELGVQPFGDYIAYQPLTSIDTRWSFYQTTEARVYLWDILFAGGQISIYEWRDSLESFWVQRAAFEIEAGLKWKFLEIGVRRGCSHPIIPTFFISPENWLWESSYSEIYLRLEGKIGGKK